MNVTEQEMLDIVKNAKTVAVEGMQDEKKMDRGGLPDPRHAPAAGMKIFPVNPNIQSSLGEKAYAAVKDLPIKVDILDVFRRRTSFQPWSTRYWPCLKEKRPRSFGSRPGITHPEAESPIGKSGA